LDPKRIFPSTVRITRIPLLTGDRVGKMIEETKFLIFCLKHNILLSVELFQKEKSIPAIFMILSAYTLPVFIIYLVK
jgi:hypothetical protein